MPGTYARGVAELDDTALVVCLELQHSDTILQLLCDWTHMGQDSQHWWGIMLTIVILVSGD